MNDQGPDHTHLVSLVYEAIFSPRLWSGFGGQALPAGETAEAQDFLDAGYLGNVVPHLEQALSAGGQRLDSGARETSVRPPTPRLSLPLCIVTRDMKVLEITPAAADAIESHCELTLDDHRLRSMDVAADSRLREAVARAIDEGATGVLSLSAGPAGDATILTSPIAWPATGQRQVFAAVYVNSMTEDLERLTTILMQAYSLSQSEAEVTTALALGASIEAIAARKSRSVNTIRTQVKQVFAKTSTRRQNELVALVLGAPALWARANPPQANDTARGRRHLSLRDGRQVCFGDYGPREGAPVILCHHLLGSRFDAPRDQGLLDRLGVRLIVPERPGIGESDAAPDRPLGDYASDIAELMDALSVERAAMAGFSSGGPFAAACAARLPDRVSSLGLIASLYPVDELPSDIPVGMTQRLVTNLSRHWPTAATRLLEFRYRKLLADPDAAFEEYRTRGNPADRELMSRADYRETRLDNLGVARHVEPRQFAKELTLLARPWDFRVSDIAAPTYIWHGEQDDYFAVGHARALACQMPNALIETRHDWGHFFLYANWEEILATLARGTATAPRR
ncbi:MAG: alpha/beta fold hydrolase [Pseudomonadales bacterium]|nr:alpha/beta fold hydrolase [Pseudomonadales bacterium]